MRWSQLAISCSLLALSGCGYQFQVEGAGPTVGGVAPAAAKPAGEAPRLAIRMFENKTFEPNIEVKVTGYARREFSAGSGARVMTDGEATDYVLKGQVIGAGVTSLTFTLQGTFESRATVTLNARVEHVKTGKVVWNQAATGSSEYFVTQDLQFNRVLENRAMEQAGILAAQDLATRFLYLVESGELARLTAAGGITLPSAPSPLAPSPAPSPGGPFGR